MNFFEEHLECELVLVVAQTYLHFEQVCVLHAVFDFNLAFNCYVSGNLSSLQDVHFGMLHAVLGHI